MDMIYAVDLAGTFVFAISGALAAEEKDFDLWGVFILAFVTAVGGGTVRDVLIGSTPVGWMKDLNYIYLITAALPLVYFFKKPLIGFRRGFFLFDAIGIGLFTILGINKTLGLGLSPIVALLMGVVSSVFGGVIRDVLSNEIPLIFRKEIYASACIAGGTVYLLMSRFMTVSGAYLMIPIGLVILIRIVAVKHKWSLPFSPRS
ncbi:MAG: trimeric intracellular cation channel family protein [Bacteroidota bacterium]